MRDLLLRTKGGWVDLFDLQLETTSWACLLESGLKLIFLWKAQSLTFFKSSFNSFVEVFTSWTTENNDLSPAKSFALDVKFSDRSFIKIKNNMDLHRRSLRNSWQMTNFNHLTQPFVSYCLKNQIRCEEVHQKCRFVLIWNKTLRARLYQKFISREIFKHFVKNKSFKYFTTNRKY